VTQLPLIVERYLLKDSSNGMHYLCEHGDLADTLKEWPHLTVVSWPERLVFE
jgi:hypothetical protein